MKRQLICFLVTSLMAVGAAAQPKFSVPHGLYDNAFSVSISSDKGAPIRYTLDGSEPTSKSALYASPISVTKTTLIRAVEVVGDSLSPISTVSYIFTSSVLSQPNNPEGYPTTWGQYTQVSGTAMADYEMDPEMTGDPNLRQKIADGLKTLPILSIVSDKDNFFSHENDSMRGGIYIFTGPPVGDATGHGWTRPASIELMGGPQQHNLSTTCGIRLHGGHGRLAEKNPKHSFRLVFKKEYGKKTLKYPLYGEGEPEQFDQLVLRCHFGNSWQHWSESIRQKAQYTRDVWARRMQRKMGHTAVNALYVHLFLNGMYWGLYNIAERVDDQFCKNYEGGKKSDYDVIKVEEDGGNHIEASEGTLDAWNQMAAVAYNAADDEAYEQLDSLLDIDNFIDYMLINQYGGNTDWDHHNWYAFRKHGENSEGFKFLCWDTEMIIEDANANVLGTNNGYRFPTGIFHNLLQNPKFARRYQRRAKEVLAADGLLGEASAVELWDSLYNTISLAIYDESARWGDYRRDVHRWQQRGQLYTVDDFYLPERNRLLTQFFPYRSERVLSAILNYVNIDDFEAPEDWVPLTASMFHRWDGTGANANIVDEQPGAELNLKKTVNGGGVVAGFSSVSYDLYADVSQYDKLMLRGSGSRLRILANRLTDHGPYKIIIVSFDESDPYWDADLGAIVLPLQDLATVATNQGESRVDKFVHINAMKVDTGNSATVSNIYLVPKLVDTFVETLRNTRADGRYYNLNGQQVTRPAKGIFVKNGRKIIVK